MPRLRESNSGNRDAKVRRRRTEEDEEQRVLKCLNESLDGESLKMEGRRKSFPELRNEVTRKMEGEEDEMEDKDPSKERTCLVFFHSSVIILSLSHVFPFSSAAARVNT